MRSLLLCVGLLISFSFDLSFTMHDEQSVKDFIEKFFTDFCDMNDPEIYFTRNAETSWVGVEAIGQEAIKNHFEAFKKNNYTCKFSLEFTSVNITADSADVRLNLTVIATMTGHEFDNYEAGKKLDKVEKKVDGKPAKHDVVAQLIVHEEEWKIQRLVQGNHLYSTSASQSGIKFA